MIRSCSLAANPGAGHGGWHPAPSQLGDLDGRPGPGGPTAVCEPSVHHLKPSKCSAAGHHSPDLAQDSLCPGCAVIRGTQVRGNNLQLQASLFLMRVLLLLRWKSGYKEAYLTEVIIQAEHQFIAFAQTSYG